MVARRSEGTVQSAPHRSSLAASWLLRYRRCVWLTTFRTRALLAQFQAMRFGLLTRHIVDWTVNQGSPWPRNRRFLNASRRACVSTGAKGNRFRRFSGIQFRQRAAGRQHFALPPRPGSLTLPSCTAMRLSLSQDKQLSSSALNRRGKVETRRTRSRSRVNPRAGSWSLAACPKSYRPVSPGE